MANNNSTQRRLDLKLVGYHYRYEAPYGADVCVYCGDPATGLDHVPPISYMASIKDIMPGIGRIDCVVYPACKDCNVRLSTYIETSITARRKEIRRKLRAKHRRLLGAYDWSDDELEKLGWVLRTYIKSQENRRQWITNRLRFPQVWHSNGRQWHDNQG